MNNIKEKVLKILENTGTTMGEIVPYMDFKDKEYDLIMIGDQHMFIPYIMMKIEGDDELYSTGLTLEWLKDMLITIGNGK